MRDLSTSLSMDFLYAVNSNWLLRLFHVWLGLTIINPANFQVNTIGLISRSG